METPLLTLNIGIGMQTSRYSLTNLGTPGNFKISEPYGATLNLYSSYLTIVIPQDLDFLTPGVLPEYKIMYDEIDYLKHGILFIRIFHHKPNLSQIIYIMGVAGTWSIYKKIKNCIKKNNLPLVAK